MAISNKKKYKCPYCLHEFTKAEAKMQRNSRGDEYFMCPNAKLENERPVCGKRLPLNFFSSDTSVISIVGGTGTGKTYFVMALRRILDRGVLLKRLGISGTTYYPDLESERYFEDLWQQIINGTRLNATQRNAGAESHALCLQVDISGYRTKTIFFSFFDNPGEGFKRDSYIYDNMNLLRSDAVIFLISPEQLPNILQRVSGGGLVENATNLNTVLKNVRSVFTSDKEDPQNESFVSCIMRWARSLLPNRIPIPFAFCLSKCDLLGNVFPIINNIPQDLNRPNFEALRIISGNEVSKGKINSIISDNSRAILETMDAYDESIDMREYSSSKMFAVQSIEVKRNNAGQEVINLSPKGVSLPVYWILNKLNFM